MEATRGKLWGKNASGRIRVEMEWRRWGGRDDLAFRVHCHMTGCRGFNEHFWTFDHAMDEAQKHARVYHYKVDH